MIHIVENTLRDGSYAVDFQFSSADVSAIVGGLDKLGFEWVEVGHGLGLGAYREARYGSSLEDDLGHIRAAVNAADQAKIGVFFIPGIGTMDDLVLAAEEGISLVRIGININRFADARVFVEKAKELGLHTAVNLMKSYSVNSFEYSRIASQIDQWRIADAIYLVDSAGCMRPDMVRNYITRTRDFCQAPIGFHGHDNLSLAVANTLAAVDAGATYVDSCVRSMGRSAGNAQTEILVFLLREMGCLDRSIDLYDLYEFANRVVVSRMTRQQGRSDEEIHIGVSRFHTSFMGIAVEVSEEFGVDVRRLIASMSTINTLDPTRELFRVVAKDLKEGQGLV